MALHFTQTEFATRRNKLSAELEARGLDGILLFAPESHYWLTGYDTFGYCFFQCLVYTVDGRMELLTRSADLRQARHTSIIEDIHIWVDGADATPANDLKALMARMGLQNKNIGIETETPGLTHRNGKMVETSLEGFCQLVEATEIVPALRSVKSDAELAYVRTAGKLTDAALNAAIDTAGPGVDEGKILAAQHNAIFTAGGDYAGNEFIIGSADDALLCRYKSGRRVLDAQDQLTLEFAGAWRHYHSAQMHTFAIGKPTDRQVELFDAAKEAHLACVEQLRPDRTAGDVFEAHARVMDARGLQEHRLNACGYSLGTRFSPCWMDTPMFYKDNPTEIVPGMVMFIHMIIMDSASNTAMCLGHTYVVTDGAPEPLSEAPLEMVVRS